MFTLFNDAIQQKKMQDQMEANAAMQQNLEARRTNPTMYEQPGNIVDFSNPASYMRGNAYNPYGYDNPFNNPNIQCQMGIVPTVPDAPPPPVPTYPQMNGTWYGNQMPFDNQFTGYTGGMYYNSDSTDFMEPDEEDYAEGRAVRVFIMTESQRREYEEAQERDREAKPYKDYFERNFTNYAERLQVHIIRTPIEPEVKEEDNKQQEKLSSDYEELKKAQEELKKRNDELSDMLDFEGIDTARLEIPDEHPLVLKLRDRREQKKLCEEISVYNTMIATVLYNIKFFIPDITREEYERYVEVIKNKLNEYRELEEKNQDENGYIDYRVPYRNRPLPEFDETEEGGREYFADQESKVNPTPRIEYKEMEEYEYAYDRGRKLSEEERLIFCEYEFVKLEVEVKKLRLKQLAEYNKKLQGVTEETIRRQREEKKRLSEVENESYNIYDPIQVYYHEVRVRQKRQQQQYELYRHIFKNSKTDKEFDEWWFGKDSNEVRQRMSPEEAMRARKREYKDRMLELNIQKINSLKPISSEEICYAIRRKQQEILGRIFGNSLQEAHNTREYFTKVVPQALYELSMMNIEDQEREGQREAIMQNPFEYRKALLELGNGNQLVNRNFDRSKSIFKDAKPVDPKYGLPSNYVDISTSEEYQKRKKLFMDYCENSRGNIPLKPIYK